MSQGTQGATLVLDLDGTLYGWDGKPDYSAKGILRGSWAFPDARRRVVEAILAGWRVEVLTGRCRDTEAATRLLMFDDYPDLYEGRIHFIGDRDGWMGWDAYTRRKAESLASISHNAVYVGDRPQDAEAASRAGAGFMPAHLWRAGYAYAHLLPFMECVGNSVASATNPTQEQENSAVMGSDSDTGVGHA